jgi:hypothetical protein
MSDTKARKPAFERRTRSKARTAWVTVSVLTIVNVSALLNAQSGDPQSELQQRLASLFTVTKVTADGRDTTATGTQVELRKNGFMAYSVESPVPYLNNYDKKGHISQPFMSNLGTGVLAQGRKNYPTRFFRAGEKLWVVALLVKRDGVTFRLYSDPYGAIRYYGDLKFPFDKGSTPASDEALARISEALTAQPVDTTGTRTPIAGDQPSPPSEPVRIDVGHTIDQVVAVLGQPERTANVGNKQLYFYKDLKITFVDGKVSDVQ